MAHGAAHDAAQDVAAPLVARQHAIGDEEGAGAQVIGIAGGSAAAGTISASGLYTPPATLPAVNPVTITAVSQANTATTGTASEAVWNPIAVVTSATATQVGTTSSLAVDVKGTGFVSGSVLQFNGTAAATTFVSSTEVKATYIPAMDVASTTVTLVNPDPGSSVSGNFTLNFALPVSVQLTGAAQTRLGTTTQFTAVVNNTANQNVTWQVNGVTGGSAATGTISVTGIYTPPATIPAAGTVTIGAVSVANTAVSGTQTETLYNAAPVLVSGTATQVGTGTSFTLDLKGTSFVTGATIQINGTTVTTAFVSATEVTATFTPANGATTLVATVTNPNPGSSVSNALTVSFGSAISVTVSGAAQTRLGTTTQFTAVVHNNTNQNVTWQVNGITGGSAATGTISTAGLYTPPTTIPSQNPVTIGAVSVANTAVSGTLSELVWNPVPTVTSGVATQTGSNPVLLMDVMGTNFVQGATILIDGNAATTTYISSTELQANFTPANGATKAAVAVQNPNPGSATSSTVNVTFTVILATVTQAGRILDQTTFGGTLANIQHVQQIGIDSYITEQFNTPTTLEPGGLAPLPADCFNLAIPCEQSQWWKVSITGQDQLRQRVAFALSELFVVSTIVDTFAGIPYYNNLLANDAFTNYYTIMNDVSLSPAMGFYLNMLDSAAAPAGQIPNENYPRELMQLFTIGLSQLNQDGTMQLDSNGNPIPTYTESMVEGFAKAYTGWTWQPADGSVPKNFNQNRNWPAPMAAVASLHDTTAKTILGGVVIPAGGTAQSDLTASLTTIFNHPNVPPFVSKQLIQHLVTGNPSPAYVARIAAVFTNNGSGVRGDMQAVIRAILEDTEARAGDTNPSFDGGHMREPMMRMTSILRGLGATNTNAGTDTDYYSPGNLTSPLGEKPYGQASVFNFYPPSYVIPGTTINSPEFALENTATANAYLTMVNQLVYNKLGSFTIDLSATSAWGLLAANPANLVDALSNLFMYGAMPANMRTAIINHITTLTDPAQRARVATYLVLTSSQYKIIH